MWRTTKGARELWYCNTVLIIFALDFSTKCTLLGYFLVSWENVSKTRRGYKRSSGRKRYPSPIQAFVAISCCASSKRQSPERTRSESKLYAFVVGFSKCFRKYANSTAHDRDTGLKFTAGIVQSRLGVPLRTSDH